MTNTTTDAAEAAWTFEKDSRDICFSGSPVFKVYEASDFPCIEPEDRAEAGQWYDAQAQTVVLMLNSLLHDQPTAEAASGAGEREVHSDDVAVDLFAAQMKAKLAAARAKGRHGWDDPAQCSTDYLRHLLHEHVGKGDPVDVANFCMMLAHYGASTAVPVDDQDREPTRRMLTAGASAAFDGPWPDNTAAIWRAMWDARTPSLPPATDPAMVQDDRYDRLAETVRIVVDEMAEDTDVDTDDWQKMLKSALAAAPTATDPAMKAEACNCQRYPTHQANDCPQHGLEAPFDGVPHDDAARIVTTTSKCTTMTEAEARDMLRHNSADAIVEAMRERGFVAALAAAPTIPATGEAVPEGMKPWHGGDEPADWNGGPVLRRHGGMSMPAGAYAWLSNGGGAGNVIAYTPKATIPATGHAATEGEGASHADRT